jgi:hypothetical protein
MTPIAAASTATGPGERTPANRLGNMSCRPSTEVTHPSNDPARQLVPAFRAVLAIPPRDHPGSPQALLRALGIATTGLARAIASIGSRRSMVPGTGGPSPVAPTRTSCEQGRGAAPQPTYGGVDPAPAGLLAATPADNVRPGAARDRSLERIARHGAPRPAHGWASGT